MKHIIAIGGGSSSKQSTLAIDQKIVELAKIQIVSRTRGASYIAGIFGDPSSSNEKKGAVLSSTRPPNVLFIPTASNDDANYIEDMRKIYEENLNCNFQSLYLHGNTDHPKVTDHMAIALQIKKADIIYVGGGNTLKMMKLWRQLGVDKLLIEAFHRGVICCGLSAGSICWFESGHSDSLSFWHPEDWDYIKVRCLGLIKGTHCPHFNSETLGVKREDNFKRMLQKRGGLGIAVDDNAALHFEIEDEAVFPIKLSFNDSQPGLNLNVLKSVPDAGAYLLKRKSAKVHLQAINK
jgi:dipeptidase E